jgi:hypothetical protein
VRVAADRQVDAVGGDARLAPLAGDR